MRSIYTMHSCLFGGRVDPQIGYTAGSGNIANASAKRCNQVIITLFLNQINLNAKQSELLNIKDLFALSIVNKSFIKQVKQSRNIWMCFITRFATERNGKSYYLNYNIISDNTSKTTLSCNTLTMVELMVACRQMKELNKKLLDTYGDDDYYSFLKTNTSLKAIEYNYPELLKVFIACGIDINDDLDSGHITGPLLIHAAELGRIKCLHILLQGGANINVYNQCGEPALLRALRSKEEGAKECVIKLLSAGADPNDIGYRAYNITWKDSPLGYALNTNHPTAYMLINAAAVYGHIDDRDEEQMTLLMHMVDQGQEDYVRMLLEVGARIDIQDKNGKTALDHAKEAKHKRGWESQGKKNQIIQMLENQVAI